MLYEPSKTKKYIIIGAVAIVLAFLAVVAIPLFYKISQIPTADLPKNPQQLKIRKDMKEVAKKLKDQPISEQKTKEDVKSVSQEMEKLPSPSQEDMQKVSKELNQSVK